MPPVIPYGRQEITEEDLLAVTKVLNSDYLTQGPAIKEFESAFAAYVGAKYAVAVSNATCALHLAALALGIDKNSTVITTPITFVASANCARYCGAEVIFADIDPDTYLIDLNQVESLLKKHASKGIKAVIPVDFAGNPINLQELHFLCSKYNCSIIDDACHAPGATFKDSDGIVQHTGNGNFADCSIFSFHPVKHIATGEGGMLTTNNRELYEKTAKLRTHGITKQQEELDENHGGWYYEMQELGFNYRLTDIAAALGTSQLKRADSNLKRRIEIAKLYDSYFKKKGIKHQKTTTGATNAYHLYVIEHPERKKLYDFLITKGIACQIHYIPVHLQPYYKKLGWKKGDFPKAEKYYQECLSLPMYPSLKQEQLDYIFSVLETFT